MPRGVYVRTAKHREALRGRKNRLGQLTPALAPTERASTEDFYWAAGFYEGEGYVGRAASTVSIAQKHREPLDWMRARFGGKVASQEVRGIFLWCVHGARARGFLMSIYGLLSAHRQAQIRNQSLVGHRRGR